VRHPLSTITWTAALAALVFAPRASAEPAPPVKSAPAAAPAVGADWVAVTLSSDDPRAALYAKEPRKVGIGDEVADSWSFVCLAPCGDRVDPQKAYRVMGEALVPSIEFNVAPGSGSIAVLVRARHPASRAVTTTLAIAGTGSAIGGVLLLLVDLVEHGAGSAIASGSASAKKKLLSGADTYGDVGAGLLLGGVALGGAALVYLATVGKTELAPAGATTERAHAGNGDGIRFFPLGFSF
jgi:hypothetical protein